MLLEATVEVWEMLLLHRVLTDSHSWFAHLEGAPPEAFLPGRAEQVVAESSEPWNCGVHGQE